MRDNGGELEYVEGVGTVWTPDESRLIGCARPGCPHEFFYVPARTFPGLCLACADEVK